MKTLLTLQFFAGFFLILSLVSTTASAQQNPRDLFEQARMLDEGNQSLSEAIALYRRVATLSTDERTLAAEAQLRVGLLYERLGRTAEAQRAFAAVVNEYTDQTEAARQAQARMATLRQHDAVDEIDDVVVRQVWAPAMDTGGRISPDGRYLSFVDWWYTGDVAIRDLTTGENRRLTNKGTWQENPNEYAVGSIISPDGKQVAYTWFDYGSREHCCVDLRIIALTGEDTAAKPRILYRNEDVSYIQPFDWSPDGEHVLALFTRKDQTNQIGLISIADGSVQVLKTFDWRYPGHISFSPDGRFIVYDFPTKEDAPERDIFVLAADGSHENPLVEHPSDDYVLGWAPDGTRVLFASDRTGSWDAWLLPVADGKPRESPELVKRNIGRVRPMGFTRSGSFYYGVTTGTQDVYITTLDRATGEVLAPPVKISQRFEGRNVGSDWSPDGQYLAYASRRDEGFPVRPTGSWTLVIRSSETGQERELPLKLTNSRLLTPRWSPDGRSLLAVGADDKRREGIYRIDAQTGTVTPLVQIGPEASILAHAAVWSRDGKAIFYPHFDRTTKTMRILTQDLETGQEKELYRWSGKISSGNFFKGLALSPDGRQLALCRAHDLKVMPATGGESHELFRLQPQEQQDGIQITSVAWTPDGRHLLFSKPTWLPNTQGEGRKLELWRISAQGGASQRLGLAMDGFELYGLSVHSDGRRLAFSASIGGNQTEVWVMEHFLPEDEGTE